MATSSGAVTTQTDDLSIQANESIVDFATGIRTHKGQVRVRHGNVRLTADKLTEYRQGGKVVRVVAIGKPVTFSQSAPFINDVKEGKASKAEYQPSTRILKLWNYQVKDISGSQMKGQRATYKFRRE
ncbi:MAG: hypothetical protein HOI95_04395 [Chromatiales bacterium]|nr:hypothetical protein [Chromatiales bacterium]